MYREVLLCLSLLFVTYGQVFEESKIVYTKQGALRGYRSPKYDVFEFVNVPYATAPTGVDKFKAPLPPPSWNGTWEAMDRGIICHQPTWNMPLPNGTQMQEDCLVANIYVPDTPEINLPVLVNFHSGGFLAGYGTQESPIALVDSKKIVAVTFNYRLGIQGFLCLGTELAPGNAGMKDQVALLRWVRDNIKIFGGNPDEVTIAGCSAGGSSVEAILLSNATRGLFHKVISESGCSLSPFAIQYDPIKTAIDHALLLNFNNPDNTTALGEFYASLSWQNLVEPTAQYAFSKDSNFQFVPCVERDLGKERFLEEGPISILRGGDVPPQPMLYGFATMEGLIRASQATEWIAAMNTNFTDFLTPNLMFENEQQRQQVANEIKEFYFGAGVINTSHIFSFIDYFSDVMFIHSIRRAIAYHVSAGNAQVYLYEYGYTHNSSMEVPFTNVTGAAHCNQHAAALGIPPSENPSDEYVAMSRIMGEIYINFITTGNPNSLTWNSSIPDWPTVGFHRYPYLHINNNATTVVYDWDPIAEALANRTRFWDNIHTLYGTRMPIPPMPSTATHVLLSYQLIVVAIFALLTYK